MALFGIGDDATVSAVAGLGLDIQSGLGQWLSDNGMPEAGAKLADALGVGVTEAGVAVDGGLKSWLSSDEGGQALDSYTKDLSERLSNGTVIKPRYEPPDLPEEESNTGTGTQGNSRTPAYASGTTWFGGGWAKVHRDEVVNLAAGPVYNARQARKFAPAGVVVNAVINNRIDQAQFERMLRTAVRKAQVG
jgi:hypothetical protein